MHRPRLLPPGPPLGRPRVSVVVPCYNYGRYLPGCVASVLSQEGVDVEVVVVDDASPDGSVAVADRLAAADTRVRVVKHSVNQGHIATYNDGLDVVTGDYLLLLSADDALPPGALARATALLSRHPEVGLVYGPAVTFSDDPPDLPPASASSWAVWPGREWLTDRCATGQNVVDCPAAVMRTDVYRRVGPYRSTLPHGADLAMWLAAAQVSDVAYVRGAPQAFYRVHELSMSRSTYHLFTTDGIVRDLEEKRQCFDEVLDARSVSDGLAARARRALADQALGIALRTFVWGTASTWPVEELERFATRTDPASPASRRGRALRRRCRIGPARARRHPLLLPREVADKGFERFRAWRREAAGL